MPPSCPLSEGPAAGFGVERVTRPDLGTKRRFAARIVASLWHVQWLTGASLDPKSGGHGGGGHFTRSQSTARQSRGITLAKSLRSFGGGVAQLVRAGES